MAKELDKCRDKIYNSEDQNDTVARNADELLSHGSKFAVVWFLVLNFQIFIRKTRDLTCFLID